MTRNDYELIARVFKARVESDAGKGNEWIIKVLAQDFANMAVQQNARFKEDIFFKACGL